MRRNLEDNCEHEVISYGCSAHYLNLLAKDIQISGVKEHVVQVNKYFRNGHLPAAWYKAASGKKLTLPIDVRWNSVGDCLQSYIDNWSVLPKVCEEHRDEIDRNIAEKVSNIGLKRNVEDYLTRMKPVSVALDRSQSDMCCISDVVDLWKQVETDLSSQPTTVLTKLKSLITKA